MAAASAVKTGIDGVVLRNSGTYGSPTLVEIDRVRDVIPAFPWDMVDASSRASPVKLYEKTQTDWSVQLVVRADDADTGAQALYDAAMSKTKLDLVVLDGPVTEEGAAGVRAHWHVSLSGTSQGAGDVQYWTFDLKPSFHTDGVPKIADVGAASAVTYTAL
jgi:hypothetical protein